MTVDGPLNCEYTPSMGAYQSKCERYSDAGTRVSVFKLVTSITRVVASQLPPAPPGLRRSSLLSPGYRACLSRDGLKLNTCGPPRAVRPTAGTWHRVHTGRASAQQLNYFLCILHTPSIGFRK